jgi:hypothetical protein
VVPEKILEGLETFSSLTSKEQSVLHNMTSGVSTHSAAYVAVFGEKSDETATARTKAYAFFQRSEVQAALRELQAAQRQQYAILRDQLIQTLIGDVSFDMREAFDDTGKLKPVPDMPEHIRRRITDYSEGRYGDRVKFVDRQRSLAMLLDLLGIGQSSPGMTINVNLGDVKTQDVSVDVTPSGEDGVQLNL